MRLSYQQVAEHIIWAFQREKKRLFVFGVGIPFAASLLLWLGQFLTQQWAALPQVADAVWRLFLLPIFLRLPCGLLTFSSLREQEIKRGALASRVRRLALPIVLFGLLSELVTGLCDLLYLFLYQAACSPEENLVLAFTALIGLLPLLLGMGAISYFSIYFYGCLTRYEGNFRETMRITWQTVTTRPGGRIWAEIKFVGPLLLVQVGLGALGNGLSGPLLFVLMLFSQALFLLQLMAECVILQSFTKEGLPRIRKRKKRRLAEQKMKK